MGTLNPETVSTGLAQIAELARAAPDLSFVSIHHRIDLPLLKRAFEQTAKNASPGVDGVTADQYEKDFSNNLDSLLTRFRSGSYRAPNVRRVHIPKGKGKTRPIGIPTFEDKVLQRAVSWLVGAIYEQDFRSTSYGFRPGRSAHQALRTARERLNRGGGWIVELDIERFFDTLDHRQLRGFLDRRVQDGVIRRTIDKWLKAGIFEAGNVTYPKAGTPQGGVISPLLANIYLHEVLDCWIEDEIAPCLCGSVDLIRFADDAVLIFDTEHDARRVLDVLPKRFARFGLRLHPEKTRLISFGMPSSNAGSVSTGGESPQPFDFLGFTFYWGRAFRSGRWVVKLQTASDRLRRSLRLIAQWCRANRHMSISDQRAMLSRKLLGHYGYYGLSGNGSRLRRFLLGVFRVWRKWLDRRSQRGRMPWWRFNLLLKRYPLPPVRIIHRWYGHAANH